MIGNASTLTGNIFFNMVLSDFIFKMSYPAIGINRTIGINRNIFLKWFYLFKYFFFCYGIEKKLFRKTSSTTFINIVYVFFRIFLKRWRVLLNYTVFLQKNHKKFRLHFWPRIFEISEKWVAETVYHKELARGLLQ